MTDLRKAAEMALEAFEVLDRRGGLGLDVHEYIRTKIEALRQALAQPEHEPVGACVTCGAPKSEWLVDAVNISQECVDETAKGEHEPWPSVQCVCGGTIYFKYTPPVSDYHEGWEEGFKAGKREWVGLTDEEIDDWFFQRLKQAGDGWALDDVVRAVEAKLKEKNA